MNNYLYIIQLLLGNLLSLNVVIEYISITPSFVLIASLLSFSFPLSKSSFLQDSVFLHEVFADVANCISLLFQIPQGEKKALLTEGLLCRLKRYVMFFLNTIVWIVMLGRIVAFKDVYTIPRFCSYPVLDTQTPWRVEFVMYFAETLLIRVLMSWLMKVF